jgi:hypothetical protein
MLHVTRLTRQATITQCQPATYTWTPTTPPYRLSILENTLSVNPSFTSDAATAEIPWASTATWMVDSMAGTNVTVMIRDADGNVALSYPRVVGTGSGECLEQAVQDLVVQ